MQYTDTEINALLKAIPAPNFGTNSFTFYNTETKETIENAISINQFGEVTFKDRTTEIKLTDFIKMKTILYEEIKDINQLYTLYFSDRYNEKITLGDLFKKVYYEKTFSSNLFFTDRASKKVDVSLENMIISNFYDIIPVQSISGGQVVYTKALSNKTTSVGTLLSYSNLWFDVRNVEIITTDYVDGVQGSYSALIPLTIKAQKPTTTIFRIYDATAGIELCRTTFTSQPSTLPTTYIIPLSYKGISPDSPIVSQNDACVCITQQDFENLELTNGIDDGKEISENLQNYRSIPASQHLIKVQFQTCDVVEEYINNYSFGRRFSATGDTCLNVELYKDEQNNTDIITYNSKFRLQDVKNVNNEYTISLDKFKFYFTSDYTVTASPSQNVRIWVSNKTKDGFTIKWNRYNKDCEVNWTITEKSKLSTSGVQRLDDTTRELNYSLFKNQLDNIKNRNVCGDLNVCKKEYANYTFKYLLPFQKDTVDVGSTSPIDSSLLLNGYGEYYIYGYPSITASNIEGRYYYSKTMPRYRIYFEPTNNNTIGKWIYTGSPDPGETIKFTYLPNDGYCSIDQQTVLLPTATGPKYSCEKCQCAEEYNVKFKIKTYDWLVPPISSNYYYTTDSYGTLAYALDANKFTFDTIIEDSFGNSIVNSTYIMEISGVSGEGICAPNTEVSVKQYISYDDSILSTCKSISSSIDVPIYPQSIQNYNIYDNLGIAALDSALYYSSKFEDVKQYNDFIAGTLGQINCQIDETIANISGNGFLYANNQGKYSSLFDPTNPVLLKTSSQGIGLIKFVIPYSGLLGIEAFSNQVLIFDPRLAVAQNPNSLPLFPGFDPIGNKKSLLDVKQHIRTAQQFNFKLPPFPNFAVNTSQDGFVLVDGNKYNPLFDYRNYRLSGSYIEKFGDTIFVPNPLSYYNSGLVHGSHIALPSGDLYKLKLLDNTNTYLTAFYNGKPLYVRSGNLAFVQITTEMWKNGLLINNGITFFN